jgi:hypothetical protein
MSEIKTGKSQQTLQIANLIAFIGTLIVNGLANALPLNGKNTGAISDSYPNLFVPAGLTFSIWGVIYLFLAIFSFYQAKGLGKKTTPHVEYLDQISWFFLIGSVSNMLWIFAWHWEVLPLTIVLMLGLFVSLLMIYLRLGIGVKKVDKKTKWLVHVPFSIYIGWITVATIANVTALLVSLGVPYDDAAAGVWTILVILVGAGITIANLLTRGDTAYALVVIWAYLGIVIKRIATVPAQPAIVVVTIIAIVAIAVVWVLKLLKKK